MTRWPIAAAPVLLGLAGPAPAQEMPCADLDSAMARLADAYGESLAGIGQVGPSAAIGLFTAADGATWTLVLIRDDGRACLLAEGRGWRRTRLAGTPP